MGIAKYFYTRRSEGYKLLVAEERLMGIKPKPKKTKNKTIKPSPKNESASDLLKGLL